VNNIFPGAVAGILLAAILAASMSTADSQLLVASSSFSSDFYQPVVRKNKASNSEMMWIGRAVVVVVTLVAFYIASTGIGDNTSWASSIMAMVENAWGLFGASFGPAILLSLFWRRFNYAGALGAIIAGAVVDIAWLAFFSGTGIYEIVPGFIASFIVGVIVTLATPEPGKDVVAIFDAATSRE
jgi:sodium/proline symporter